MSNWENRPRGFWHGMHVYASLVVFFVGVALIVRLSRRMRELGGSLSVENPVGQARRVPSCAGVDKIVHLATIGG